jgi:S-methylmethionine-dependent homocysteine/selenocysteine methylase
MPKYRAHLPQLTADFFLTDGGIETTLIYQYGLSLPEFASFVLLASDSGTAALRRYFEAYLSLAARYRAGVILETATWRASRDWGAKLGYPPAALAALNRQAVRMLEPLRAAAEARHTVVVLSGNVGPRGDGYVPGARMSAADAERYHRDQIEIFAETEADLVTALTMNYVEEAVGVVLASRALGLPVVISFTVETDGRLPTGDSLHEAIKATDRATDGYPAYYMINCAHPTHFAGVLAADGEWRHRLRGVRANASARSHAELNEATELDAGDIAEFGVLHRELRSAVPGLTVFGGCCGTDHRHIDAICRALGRTDSA